jgi:predicted DNA-binding protein YlxM (UPF0122 family)
MSDFTVKEIADILRVSKTTVQKAIKAAGITYDYIERNKQYYSMEKTRKIVFLIRADFDFAIFENKLANSQAKTKNQGENPQTEIDKSPIEIENSAYETNNSQNHNKSEIAALHKLIDLVQKQLEEKDKQLAIKDKQIQDLSDLLAQAMQLIERQQYIAEADKTKQLLESKKQDEEIIITEATQAQEDNKQIAADAKQPKEDLWKRFLKNKE